MSRLPLSLLFLVVVAASASGQAAIQRLDRSDPAYLQHQRMVAEYHQAQAQGGPLPPLVLFTVTPEEESNLFDLSARLMLPYAAIASLNRLDSPALHGETLLVPSQPGLFAFPSPQGRLEQSVSSRVRTSPSGLDLVLADSGAPVSVRFAPGLDFSPQERDTFLRVRFANPLPAGVVSSVFGYRNHPVTGIWSFHGGIDLAADFGTPVTVAADGVVSSIDRDPWLGLSVTVVHRASFATVYAHLQETTVAAGQTMSAGDIVGYVGSTGLSTGPHLHFEIRHRGESRNPEEYIQWDY